MKLDHTSWENILVHVLGVSLADLVAPYWMATLLPAPGDGKLHVRPLAGVPSPAVSDFPLTPAIQNQLAEAARQKNKVFWWDSAGTGDFLPFSLANTHAVCAVPFFGDYDRLETLLAMGFQHPVRQENFDWREPLQAASVHFQDALSIYRTIIRRAPAVHIETNCSCSNAPWGTTFATNPNALVTIGVQPRSEGCCRSSAKDYCAVAALGTGYTRLLAVRPVRSGTIRLWECVACDGVFRAACALGASPAETVEWINSAWPVGDETNRQLRLVCCADVSDSGRDYVFSGTGTHLLYENGSQTVNEVYERLSDSAPGSKPWVGQDNHLHSGDILILHTFDLPAMLCHRHDLLRRLAMLLAREGHRPMAELVPEVVSLLSTAGNDRASAESSLILLRAE
ncbi:MAG: hypothetical protein N3D11_12565 [Candidatus Sumerlaeia bacterium]|nr:hypothetical protein [Candidatus Sumerlaeia bacterium]